MKENRSRLTTWVGWRLIQKDQKQVEMFERFRNKSRCWGLRQGFEETWGVGVTVTSCDPHMPSLMHFQAELHVRHLFPPSFSAFSLDTALLFSSFLLYLLSLFL